MGRSHRTTSSLKLSASPRIDFATSSSSVHVMRSAEGPLWEAESFLPPRTKTADGSGQSGRRRCAAIIPCSPLTDCLDWRYRAAPAAAARRQPPDLAARLDTRAAMLLPLIRRGERVGLLAVGFDQPPSAVDLDASAIEAADAFMTAIELFHLRQAEELQRDVRLLLEEF